MMMDADDFRKQAEDARQMAAYAPKQGDKAFWLELADDWLNLAQKADRADKRRWKAFVADLNLRVVHTRQHLTVVADVDVGPRRPGNEIIGFGYGDAGRSLQER